MKHILKQYTKKIFETQKQKFLKAEFNYEDASVISFFDSLQKDKKYAYLEAGSGFARFPLKIQERYPDVTIECLEINPTLAHMSTQHGLHTTVGNVIDLPYNDEQFDVVHCSHVVEHLGYPHVTTALEQLLRVTKTNGYVIIRSPLWHPEFFLDIDHIRPYPPETIMNYFKHPQQQKVGAAHVRMSSVWYRRGSVRFHNVGLSKIKYYANALFAVLWLYIRFPVSKKNGYILILQKM